jgi:glutamate synthase (NADPH/NADH) large chain
MTGGVAVVLGSMGMNFGSGMTGGLAYVLREGAEEVIHGDFVNLQEVTDQEEVWLRRVLEQHVYLTDSACAARLLARLDALPLVRVQPLHFQGSIEETWRPHLAALQNRALLLTTAHAADASTVGMHA